MEQNVSKVVRKHDAAHVELDDNEIIELYWNRNERAITETDVKYGKYCRRIALNILENIGDADECLNDTYFKTWNSIPDKRPKFFQGFLGKIARNLAIDRWKNKTADKRGGGAASLVIDELSECISGNESTEEMYEARELYRSIDAFVKRLPKREQFIFMQRYFYVEPVGKIAKVLNIKENNVSLILSRTRRKLKRYLIEEGFEV